MISDSLFKTKIKQKILESWAILKVLCRLGEGPWGRCEGVNPPPAISPNVIALLHHILTEKDHKPIVMTLGWSLLEEFNYDKKISYLFIIVYYLVVILVPTLGLPLGLAIVKYWWSIYLYWMAFALLSIYSRQKRINLILHLAFWILTKKPM